jgi:hypothetical protein
MEMAERKERSEQGRREKEIGKEEDGKTKLFWHEILHLHDTLKKYISQENLRKESLDGIENEEIRVNK